jgi:hypothetical protein
MLRILETRLQPEEIPAVPMVEYAPRWKEDAGFFAEPAGEDYQKFKKMELELAALPAEIRALRASLESEQMANAELRKKVELMGRKMEAMDGEIGKLTVKK